MVCQKLLENQKLIEGGLLFGVLVAETWLGKTDKVMPGSIAELLYNLLVGKGILPPKNQGVQDGKGV